MTTARPRCCAAIKDDRECARMFWKFVKMWFLVTLVALAIHQVTPAPSASTVGSDLTFLFQNDLNWPTAPEHAGTILISKQTNNADGVAACKVLNENLLQTTGAHFKSDMTSLLDYLALQSGSPGQEFRVASASPRSCAAISVHGGVHPVSCEARLPTLCSQTAPFRPNVATDLSPQFQVQVKSKKLTVTGTRDALSFRFVGIPFADPFQRFAYSQPFSSTANITALNYGDKCLQSGQGSEDCLFLNVYTPFLPQDATKAKKNLRPVLFWIHGGAFTSGESSDGIFDGGNQASRSDVVVVTIQYRLGTLGFLALKDGITNGNFGIADQITALQWVQEHIADFGGDPSRITIHGQSAGAGSVRALLAAKPAFGLFQGAIAQSNLGGFGFATTYTEYMSIDDEWTNFGQGAVSAVGCATATDVLACLRAASANDLINVPNSPKFIVVDGKFITTPHLELDGSGPAAKAHVMFGWMRDDGSDFIGNFPTASTTLTQALLGAGLNFNVTTQVVQSPLFPMPNSGNATLDLYNLTSRVGTDGEFRCIDQATIIAAAKHKVFPSIYAYQFDRSIRGFEPIPSTCNPPATAEFPNGDPSLPYFRCHSGELYYMFGTLGQDSVPFRDWNDLIMSQVSVDVWGSFARSFNPTPSAAFLTARGYTNTTLSLRKAGQWPNITPSTKTPLRIMDIPFRNSEFLEQAQCDLLQFPATLFG